LNEAQLSFDEPVDLESVTSDAGVGTPVTLMRASDVELLGLKVSVSKVVVDLCSVRIRIEEKGDGA
jgi:hypothetical protein